MNKPWLGYLGSAFILLAGILMIFAEMPLLGCMLIVVAIAGAILKFFMMKKNGNS